MRELRETTSTPEPLRRDEPLRRETSRAAKSCDAAKCPPKMPHASASRMLSPQVRDWVSPLEPLSIRTGEFERVPVLDGPMMVSADARTPAGSRCRTAADGCAAWARLLPGCRHSCRNQSTESTAPPAQAPNASEQQKIVTLRVCAAGETRWSGAALLSALEMHGLAYGRYQVFHRRHVDGRSLFCVASLVEPGTFDVARMATEEFRGVTLFAVLPGPVEPLLTLDELLAAARGLAQELSGMVQDSKGIPLSPQRAAAMRDDVAHFQAALS